MYGSFINGMEVQIQGSIVILLNSDCVLDQIKDVMLNTGAAKVMGNDTLCIGQHVGLPPSPVDIVPLIMPFV